MDDYPRVALSIKQPWAELVLSRRKTVEVRRKAIHYRGPFWLHTGKNPDEGALPLFDLPRPLFTGGYIGIARLIDSKPFDRVLWSRLRPEHLTPGPMIDGLHAWFIEDVTPLPHSVTGNGQLGLFEVPAEDLRRLRSAMTG